MRLFAATVIVAWSLSAEAADSQQSLPPNLSAEVRAAFELLRRARAVEDIWVGDLVPEASKHRPALSQLFHDDHAVVLFRALVDRGTPAGRLYGLAGLWLKDGAAFRTAANVLEQDHVLVELDSAGGASLHPLEMREAVRRIRAAGLDGLFRTALTDLLALGQLRDNQGQRAAQQWDEADGVRDAKSSRGPRSLSQCSADFGNREGIVMRLTAWCAAALAILVSGASPAMQGAGPSSKDNAELARMFQDDQDDRKPGLHGIDWAIVKPRDDARLARARELYTSGALRTGGDWFHAALILQHSSEADDYLLAHEMCVAAVAKGEASAGWLAAASEDRYLMKIGRKQRFGTQYEPGTDPGTFRLAPIDSEMTDELREAIGAPSLAEAKASESRFNKK